ncbi:MAG: helix-turn-helix domain-containing protein [Clostridia bacterium]|nr:helix-turn-helix domain-containing protein [Clostridia bacterium]
MSDIHTEKSKIKGEEKPPENSNWGGSMPELTAFSAKNIPLEEIVSYLTKSQKERLISGYDMKSFARIFEHPDLMLTVDSFFKNGMNVSETARQLYMHRNTLIYRLNKIQKTCGIDLRNFEMAVTFQILRVLYEQK